jgi:hypothetical protein
MFPELMTLPRPAWIFLAAFALVIVVLWGWTIYRVIDGRRELRAALARDGFKVQELELRWLTRGPFSDMRLPGSQNASGQYLYRVTAEDRGGRRHTGWIRWRMPWPWQPADPWTLKWDDEPWRKSKGLSSVQFYAIVLVPPAIVLGIAAAIWRDMT